MYTQIVGNLILITNIILYIAKTNINKKNITQIYGIKDHKKK